MIYLPLKFPYVQSCHIKFKNKKQQQKCCSHVIQFGGKRKISISLSLSRQTIHQKFKCPTITILDETKREAEFNLLLPSQ